MALHLVRHGAAGSRPWAHGDDLERPLDQHGREQAKHLVTHFTGIPLRAVWSSIAIRCVDTITPTAAAHGLEVKTFRELTEGTPAADFVEMVRAEANQPDDLVICSHGNLIPEVINMLSRDGMAVTGPRGCEKGSVWTLLTRDGEIVSAVHEAKPGLSRRL